MYIGYRYREVIMGRYFAYRKRMGFLAGSLPHREAGALMHGDAAPKVGESKVGLAIAAIGGAKQRKQRLVLVDGQQLSIA